jgi:uracil phosphoribosyltransferase
MAFSLFTTVFINADQEKKSFALDRWVYEIRDPQTNAEKFRQALTKIGEYLGYEALSELPKNQVEIQTLTGATATHNLCSEDPVLVTILRAGIPLCDGVHKVFPNAEVGFIAMSRNEETLKAKIGYIALPEIKGKNVILVDTMIATGGSMLDAIKIVEQQAPKKIIVIGAIAAEYGIAQILNHNADIKVIAAAVDSKLNEKGYIVPGLGDAGDRAYGKKAG